MKIDLKRAVEVLEACGYECDELTSRDAEIAGWKASAENRLQIQGQREETIATLREQAELYEKALTASWPNSSRSEALNYWNAAKKLAATEQKP